MLCIFIITELSTLFVSRLLLLLLLLIQICKVKFNVLYSQNQLEHLQFFGFHCTEIIKTFINYNIICDLTSDVLKTGK
jgi:hypothetical protein